MYRMLGTWSRRLLRAAWMAGLVLGLAGNAVAGHVRQARHERAAPVVLNGAQTPLAGNSERMISLRHQNHMWEAADGSTYLILNRGTKGGSDALQVYSSPDHGLSWFPGPRLPGSNRFSTSDGYLVGGVLYVTYANSAGEVVFMALQQVRVAAVGTWKVLGSETVFSSPDTIAMNPAMAVDSMGTVWLAFVGQNLVTNDYSIKMLRNGSDEEGWVDTGFTFGDVDNASIERSARPVPIRGGMGMVYTVHEKIFWASRMNGWDPAQPWARQQLFASTSGDNDPYSSHFSVAADADKNVHVAISDGGRVGYLRRDAEAGTWSYKWLSKDISAGYVQASIVGGDLVVASNNGSNVMVSRSADGGQTFAVAYLLVHPAPSGEVSYPYPRIETAGHTAGPMLLLQQYVDDNEQRLLLYSVPLP
jgi:hypothetical protein